VLLLYAGDALVRPLADGLPVANVDSELTEVAVLRAFVDEGVYDVDGEPDVERLASGDALALSDARLDGETELHAEDVGVVLTLRVTVDDALVDKDARPLSDADAERQSVAVADDDVAGDVDADLLRAADCDVEWHADVLSVGEDDTQPEDDAAADVVAASLRDVLAEPVPMGDFDAVLLAAELTDTDGVTLRLAAADVLSADDLLTAGDAETQLLEETDPDVLRDARDDAVTLSVELTVALAETLEVGRAERDGPTVDEVEPVVAGLDDDEPDANDDGLPECVAV
jgi:hypothetical protein